jgi:hypothetical protein
MTTPYTDPQSIHNPATGNVPPAAWGDAVRSALEFLARPPGCSVITSSGTNAANNAWTSVVWNGTDERDTDGFHAAGSASLVVPAGLGGWYTFTGQVAFAANAVGIRMARLSVNGADTVRVGAFQAPSTGLAAYVPVSADLLLAAGDTVTVQGYQASGGTLALNGRVSMRCVAVT